MREEHDAHFSQPAAMLHITESVPGTVSVEIGSRTPAMRQKRCPPAYAGLQEGNSTALGESCLRVILPVGRCMLWRNNLDMGTS